MPKCYLGQLHENSLHGLGFRDTLVQSTLATWTASYAHSWRAEDPKQKKSSLSSMGGYMTAKDFDTAIQWPPLP